MGIFQQRPSCEPDEQRALDPRCPRSTKPRRAPRQKTAPRVDSTVAVMAVRFTLRLLAMAAPLVPWCESRSQVNTAALTSFPAVSCMSSTTCVPGDVCCGVLLAPGATDFVRCQPEPCPTNAVQLCESSAECVQLDFTCGSPVALPDGGSAMICSSPGTVIEGGQGEAAADGGTTTDAPPVDTSPGNTSPEDDAARQEHSD